MKTCQLFADTACWHKGHILKDRINLGNSELFSVNLVFVHEGIKV